MTHHVLVIGAGIIGACVTAELTRHGHRVTLLDPGAPASGITRWCPGGVRQQWGSDLNIELVRDSLPFFEQVQTLDPDVHFERCGYVFLGHSDAGAEAARQLVERQRRLGVDARLIGDEELRRLCPEVVTEGLQAASYGPNDGFVNDPVRLTQALVAAATERGATVVSQPALSLLTRGERVTGALTPDGPLEADLTVLAAGHGARALAATVGLNLPLHEEERRLHYLDGAPPQFCPAFLASPDHQWAGKQLGTRFYMSALGPLPPTEEAFKAQTYARGQHILHHLEQLRSSHVVRGYYSSTPDYQAIVDAPDSHPGLLLSVGMNGNGFMMAPALATVIRAAVQEDAPPYDLTDYRLDRFLHPTTVETAVI